MNDMHIIHAARPARPSRWGFTLVELLLVMFILSVLVGLVVGVSWYVIEEGRRKETVSTQKKLMAAISAFYKVTGHVPGAIATEQLSYEPDSSTTWKYKPEEVMSRLMSVLTTGTPNNTSGGNVDVNDPIYKATRPFLSDTGGPLTTDAYGNSMLYIRDGGLGGKPLIVSAGPDGKFGYGGNTEGKTYTADQLAQFKKDNVRSDMN